MPQYKLIYFDVRGAAEPIRQILTYAGQPFEDVRIPHAEWPTRKPELQLPWGQVPVLEVDGVPKSQSFAIMRALAKKYKLAGKNESEEYRCDEIVEAVRDVTLKVQPLFMALYKNETEKVKELKKPFVEVDAPVILKRFNDILEKGGNTWFVGNGLTYTDIIFVNLIYTFNTLLGVELEKGFPAIGKLVKAVHEDPKLKQWFENRPKTAF